MLRKWRRAAVLGRRTAQPSVKTTPVTDASFKASRLLNTAAATLAAGVLTDSGAEHYRAGFHNPVMFVAPAVSAATLTVATASAFTPRGHGGLSRVVFAASVVTGLVGFGFHVTNVSRRIGGWNSENVFHGAPMAAPLAITMAGLLGFAASRIVRSTSSRGNRLAKRDESRAAALCTLSAAGLVGTSIEAGALHFRGAFQNPFMYAPVTIPPIAAVTLATAALTGSSSAGKAAGPLLRLTTWLGIAGMGFHAWGVHRRMGGWRNWRQNLLAGPPLPAPPAFSGLALAGLAALELLEAERAE
jgi:hypothetical protein